MAFTQAAREAGALARQQNKEARAAEKLMSTGVGPSKIFCDPNAVDTNAEIRSCHIEGRLISENYTEDQIAILQWAWTDEGIASRNAGKQEARASVISDPLAKAIEKRKDDVLDRGMETWEASNPMQEVLAANERPGFRRRFLSDQTVKNRGLRGWQPVVGAGGDPVKLGTMTLAEMPEGKANQRNAHYRDIGRERLKEVNDHYMETGGKAAVSDQ